MELHLQRSQESAGCSWKWWCMHGHGGRQRAGKCSEYMRPPCTCCRALHCSYLLKYSTCQQEGTKGSYWVKCEWGQALDNMNLFRTDSCWVWGCSGEVFTAWLHDESCDEEPLSLDHSVAAQPKPASKRGNGWCRGVWGHIQMMNIYTPLFIKQNCFIWSLLSDDNE